MAPESSKATTGKSLLVAGCCLNIPPLRLSGKGYDYDLLTSIAEGHQRNLNPHGLDELLQPLSEGSILGAAHSVAIRRNLELSVQHFEPSLLNAEVITQLRIALKIKSSFKDEKQLRQQQLRALGEESGVQYFDRAIPLDELKELLKSKVGLVSLDWNIISASSKFRQRLEGTDDAHLLVNQRNERTCLAPMVLVLPNPNQDLKMYIRGYSPNPIIVPEDLFEKARHGQRVQNATIVLYSSQVMPKIEIENELPRLFRNGPFMRAVFDGGNAHVSDIQATDFVVHRTAIDAFKTAVEKQDVEAIEKALTSPLNGLQIVIYRMYVEGLFSKEYQKFMGPDLHRELSDEMEKLQKDLAKFVWFTQRSENPQKKPTSFEQLKKLAVALEYIAERIERAIPPVVLERYIADTRQQMGELIRKDPKSEHVAWWQSLIDEVGRAEERLERRNKGGTDSQPPPPNLQGLFIGTGQA